MTAVEPFYKPTQRLLDNLNARNTLTVHGYVRNNQHQLKIRQTISIDVINTISEFCPVREWINDPKLQQSYIISKWNMKENSVSIDNLEAYIKQIENDDVLQQINGAISIQIITSEQSVTDQICQQIINTGIISKLISFCYHDKYPILQKQSASIMSNIFAGSIQLKYEIFCDAIKAFTYLLTTTKYIDIYHQSLFGIANISTENEKLKNKIFQEKLFEFVSENVKYFENNNNYSDVFYDTIWCLKNIMVRPDKTGKQNNLYSWNNVKHIIPIFTRLLKIFSIEIKEKADNNTKHHQQPQMFQCIQYIVESLSDMFVYIELEPYSSYLVDIFNCDLIDLFIDFVEIANDKIAYSALVILNKFICGDDEIIEKVLSKGYLKMAMNQIHCPYESIRQCICLDLSNIAAGNIKLKKVLMEYENGELLRKIINICLYDNSSNVQEEAAYILVNMLDKSDKDMIDCLVKKDCIKALEKVMKNLNIRPLLIECLKSIDIIMSRSNDYIDKVEKAGYCGIFDILLNSFDDNDEVFHLSHSIATKYWTKDCMYKLIQCMRK